MARNSRTFEFTAAVRGYHVFKNIWQPNLEEILLCFHEIGNDFDYFSIKTCTGDDVTVGHLPREISRPTKFLIDRGAVVKSKITSAHYRRSPLLQGGLEIQCVVSVTLPGTIKNHLLLDRYKLLVERLYCEPKDEVIIGNYLTPITELLNVDRRPENKRTERNKWKVENSQEKAPRKSMDIRHFFNKSRRASSIPPKKTKSTKTAKITEADCIEDCIILN